MSDARDGKRAVRNWANLPPEVLRLVVANYLAYKPHAFIPASWLHPDFHYQRSVFEALRDAYDVERIMRVCPQWHHSLLNMDFWTVACHKIDRADTLHRQILATQRDYMFLQQPHTQPQHQQQANTNISSLTHTPFRKNFHHFNTLTRSCCLPCRVNRPLGRDGIGNVKGSIATAHFGHVPVCKHHRINYFCGVCLKDVTLASEGDHAQYAKVPESLFENEDADTWPAVHTTCFHCRREALLRAVIRYSTTTSIDLYSFIGGATLEAKDYEARSTVENFVDMAEGGVNDVINVLLERHWLQSNTNLGSLLDQAVASARYSRAEIDDYESEDDMLSDDEEDSYDMLQNQEENGIRLLAITAWARSRIMDGNWVTPNDLWYVSMGQLPHDSPWDPSVLSPTLHPVPYWLQSPSSDQNSHSINTLGKDNDGDASMSTIDESSLVHYPTVERFTPLPSHRFVQLTSTCFRNTLREILYEPLRRLVYQFAREAQAAKQDPCVRLSRVGLDDVLTMLRDEKVWYVVNSTHGNARLAHHIPYIPISTENMAPMTKNLLENFWREACAPLFQCRCSICDRALQKQAQGQTPQRPSVPQEAVAQVVSPPVKPPELHPARHPEENILLEDDEEGGKNEEVIGNEQDAIVMNVDVVDVDVELNAVNATLTPSDTGSGSASDAESNRSRKRSSASVDGDEDDINNSPSPGKSVVLGNSGVSELPRKRQRTTNSDNTEADDGDEYENDDDGNYDDDDAEEEVEEEEEVNVNSLPKGEPREVPIIVSSETPPEERGGTTRRPSSSPASSVFSSLSSGSESASSSPLSTSSDSFLLPSVSNRPLVLPSSVSPIKPGLDEGVAGVAPGSNGGIEDTVRIRGKDDSPTLLYGGDDNTQEGMRRYYA